jgi:hypothetical protein
MNKTMGIGLVVIALVLAIVPVFTDCQSQGRSLTTQDGRSVPMKCHWTGIAEIGVGVTLGLTGIASLRKQSKDSARTLAVFGGASGLMAILFPAVLIGVCANPSMICNMVMKPTLIAGGILAIAASAVMFFNAREPEVKVASTAAAV